MNNEEFYAEADAKATIAIADAHLQIEIDRLVEETVADGRKLVTIRTISAIDDIPGADFIKVAQVEGWKVVVKAGEFQPGDMCVFLEVDSFLQLSDERFAFLEKNAITWHGIKGVRLKTIRLRKQLSQGLALPLKDFPEIKKHLEDVGLGVVTMLNYDQVRDINFTGVLRVMKWEKIMSAQLAGKAKGNFPSWLRKSDQERAQNMGDEIFGTNMIERGGLLVNRYPIAGEQLALIPLEALENACATGRMVMIDGTYHHVRGKANGPASYEVTIKLDGSSMTIYRRGDGDEALEGVCSRNLDLKLEGNEENSFVSMAQSGLLAALRDTRTNVAVQGELMGPGIQGNREGFSSNRFFVYNVLDVNTGEFMTPPERAFFIREMNEVAKRNEIKVAIEHVPVVHPHCTLEELGITNMDELLKFAEGPSLNHKVREGLVFKALDGRHQFKIISNLHLEQEK